MRTICRGWGTPGLETPYRKILGQWPRVFRGSQEWAPFWWTWHSFTHQAVFENFVRILNFHPRCLISHPASYDQLARSLNPSFDRLSGSLDSEVRQLAFRGCCAGIEHFRWLFYLFDAVFYPDLKTASIVVFQFWFWAIGIDRRCGSLGPSGLDCSRPGYLKGWSLLWAEGTARLRIVVIRWNDY